MRHNTKILTAALTGLALTAGPAAAQQLIAWPMGMPNALRVILPGMPIRPILPPRPVPPRPIPGPRPAPGRSVDTTPLKISGYHIEGNITGEVAELTYNVTFHNPTGRRLEGVLVMPIPADTVLGGFTMTVSGKSMKAELLEAGQASAIYRNIVSSMRDPGLLELVGERMVRARVFPIEARSNIVVKMKISQILKKSGGLHALNIPMRSAKMTGGIKGRSSLRLNLSSAKPIRTLYSPVPGVSILRQKDRRARITYESTGDAERDFSLFYSLQENPLAAGLLSFKEEGEDGFFLLSLSPKRHADLRRVVPKDIVFIVDRSGSMDEGGKMAQAKAALAYCIGKLTPADRFGIVDFATDANAFEHSLVRATKENKARARRYVKRIEAAGGTNIEAALSVGLKLLPETSGRVPMAFFLTDGLPTVGETRMQSLLAAAGNQNKARRARLFSFGLGDDVNTLLLDKLAEMNRGAGDYVRPGENIEAKVSSLYQKIAKPALTDVRLVWRGVEARQLYPRPVADIFYGAELVVMGRYKGRGKGKLIITGKSGGKTRRFEYPVNFPGIEDRNAFLPRLWANLKVTHELDALRLAGGRPDPEVIGSIVRLAKRYGIVTPYTSFLITEEGADVNRARREADRRVVAMQADAAASGVRGGRALAQRAQKTSDFFSRAKNVFLLAAIPGPEKAIKGAGGAQSAPAAMELIMADAEKEARDELKKRGLRAARTRSAGGKTFYLRGGVWVDGEYETGLKTRFKRTRKIAYLSTEYFELLEKSPALSRYLALGPKVTVVHDGTVYQIAD